MRGKGRRLRLDSIGFSDQFLDLKNQSLIVNSLLDDFIATYEDIKTARASMRLYKDDNGLDQTTRDVYVNKIQSQINNDFDTLRNIVEQLIAIGQDPEGRAIVDYDVIFNKTTDEVVQMLINDHEIANKMTDLMNEENMRLVQWHKHNCAEYIANRDYYDSTRRNSDDVMFSWDSTFRDDWKPAYKPLTYARMIQGTLVHIPNVRIMMDPGGPGLSLEERYRTPLSMPYNWEPAREYIDIEVPNVNVLGNITGYPTNINKLKTRYYIQESEYNEFIEKRFFKAQPGKEPAMYVHTKKERKKRIKEISHIEKLIYNRKGELVERVLSNPYTKKIKILGKAGIPFKGSKEIGPPSLREYECSKGHRIKTIGSSNCEQCLIDMGYYKLKEILGDILAIKEYFNDKLADDKTAIQHMNMLMNVSKQRFDESKVVWVHTCMSKSCGQRFKSLNQSEQRCIYCNHSKVKSINILRWWSYADKEIDNGRQYVVLGKWAESIRTRFLKRLSDGRVNICECVEYKDVYDSKTKQKTGKKKRFVKYQAYHVFENEILEHRADTGEIKVISQNVVIYCDIKPISRSQIAESGNPDWRNLSLDYLQMGVNHDHIVKLSDGTMIDAHEIDIAEKQLHYRKPKEDTKQKKRKRKTFRLMIVKRPLIQMQRQSIDNLLAFLRSLS